VTTAASIGDTPGNFGSELKFGGNFAN